MATNDLGLMLHDPFSCTVCHVSPVVVVVSQKTYQKSVDSE